MLNFRKDVHFALSDGTFNMTTYGYYEAMPLIQLGMRPSNTVQDISGMMVFFFGFLSFFRLYECGDYYYCKYIFYPLF